MSVIEAQDLYLDRFEPFRQARAGVEPAWLTSARDAALARFRVLGFPTVRHEEWRFTPVGPLVDTPFRAAGDETAGVFAAEIQPFIVEGLAGPRLVFVNGRFAPDLSQTDGSFTASGSGRVVVSTLSRVLAQDPELVRPWLTERAPMARDAFSALNMAFLEEGVVISLPPGTVVAHPIQVLYYTAANVPVVSHPRTIVLAGANSQAKVVETYAGRDDSVSLTSAVTLIAGGEGSHLDHYRVERESRSGYHVSTNHVLLSRSAVFAQQNFAFGAAIARNDITVRLDAEGIECTLNGLYLGNGDRLVDHHTTIDHAMPHCASHELYKGMLDGRARGVFNGKIFVRQDAQKTDAKQTNQVLLLSDTATIDTKPQLEIFADDVKCTHGATVGQIDAEALFYLRARGIGKDEARALLVHAFARDIIDRVTIEPLRDALEAVLLEYLAAGDRPRGPLPDAASRRAG